MAGRDRTLRLVVCGGLALACGVGLAALAALYVLLALAALAGMAPRGVDAASALSGAVLWLGLGAALVVTGGGSIACRRWAPPLLSVIAWLWLLGGLVAVPLVPPMMQAALAATDAASVPTLQLWLVTFAFLGAVALVGVLVPALLVWAYRDPDVQRTCAARHPEPSWPERVPRPVLGLVVALIAAAVLSLQLALRPAVPLFGIVVGGPLAAAIIVAGSLACAGLARLVWLQSRAGWWAVTLLLTAAGVSTALTLHRVPLADLYGAMGHGAEAVSLLPDVALLAWLTWALTAATLVYMLRLKRYFDGSEARAGGTAQT